jgi:uncharacterized protein (TIGR03435 family)
MQSLRAASTALILAAAAMAVEAPPAFEVASVRLAQTERTGEGMHAPLPQIKTEPGALTMRGVSFRTSVRWAYNVVDFQVNGPDWIDQQRYDIVAKAASPVAEDRLRLMLQTLLAERFKLAVHRQTKEAQAWVLSVGKNGPKCKESAADGEYDFQADRKKMEISARRMTVAQFIDFLAPVLRAPVVDETGLKGRYDATIRVDQYMPDKPTAITDMVSILVTGIQQELGLDLKSRKMPLDFVMIDRAEKTPVEN